MRLINFPKIKHGEQVTIQFRNGRKFEFIAGEPVNFVKLADLSRNIAEIGRLIQICSPVAANVVQIGRAENIYVVFMGFNDESKPVFSAIELRVYPQEAGAHSVDFCSNFKLEKK